MATHDYKHFIIAVATMLKSDAVLKSEYDGKYKNLFS